MDPFIILSALGPLAVDLGKALIGKFVGSDFKPANVEDWVTMQRVDVERFAAINSAGGSNPSYPWVEAIVRLQRPAVALGVLVVWSVDRLGPAPTGAVDNFAGAIGFYLFGDRTLFHLKSAVKK
jgi:hypothetical protein